MCPFALPQVRWLVPCSLTFLSSLYVYVSLLFPLPPSVSLPTRLSDLSPQHANLTPVEFARTSQSSLFGKLRQRAERHDGRWLLHRSRLRQALGLGISRTRRRIRRIRLNRIRVNSHTVRWKVWLRFTVVARDARVALSARMRVEGMVFLLAARRAL